MFRLPPAVSNSHVFSQLRYIEDANLAHADEAYAHYNEERGNLPLHVLVGVVQEALDAISCHYNHTDALDHNLHLPHTAGFRHREHIFELAIPPKASLHFAVCAARSVPRCRSLRLRMDPDAGLLGSLAPYRPTHAQQGGMLATPDGDSDDEYWEFAFVDSTQVVARLPWHREKPWDQTARDLWGDCKYLAESEALPPLIDALKTNWGDWHAADEGHLEGLVSIARAEEEARRFLEEEGEEEPTDETLLHACSKNDMAVLTIAACVPQLELLIVDMTCGAPPDALPAALYLTGHCVCALAARLPRLALLDLDRALNLSGFDYVAYESSDPCDEHDIVSALSVHCTSLRYLDVMSCGFSSEALTRLVHELPSLLHVEAREARVAHTQQQDPEQSAAYIMQRRRERPLPFQAQ